MAKSVFRELEGPLLKVKCIDAILLDKPKDVHLMNVRYNTLQKLEAFCGGDFPINYMYCIMETRAKIEELRRELQK